MQVNRISKFVRCEQWIPGNKYECDRAFFNFNIDCIDDIESRENYYAFVSHANFVLYGYAPPIDHPKLNHFIGVSEFACERLVAYAKQFFNKDIEVELCYNPLMLEPKQKVLKLICASRLEDAVKGGKRVTQFIEACDRYCKEHKRHYFMLVFADKYRSVSPNVKVMRPCIDVRSYISNADVLVQLSNDMETYGYSINEALGYGVRVVCTPLTVLKELPIPKGATLICDYDMSNVDKVVAQMFEDGDVSFKYHPPKSRWGELLKKGKSTYQEEIKNMLNVRCIKDFYDNEAKCKRKIGDEFLVNKKRANDLMDSTKPGGTLVKLIDEPKEVDVEQAQAVAQAIKEVAKEEDKKVEEVVEEMVEEAKEEDIGIELINETKKATQKKEAK